MGDLSLSAWIVMILCYVICFGGAFYCLLLAWGKDPSVLLDKLGITGLMSATSEGVESAGIYKPFEYMERGPKEKGVGVFVVFLLLMIGWGFGVFDVDSEGGELGIGDANYTILDEIWEDQNRTGETETTEVAHQFLGRVNHTQFVLTWTDDDTTEGNVGGFGYQNQPDTFNLTITVPNGTIFSDEAANDVNTEEGIITIDIPLGMTKKEMRSGNIEDFEAGDWTITVECVEAGDSEEPTGIGTSFNDNGNEWTLTVSYNYFK